MIDESMALYLNCAGSSGRWPLAWPAALNLRSGLSRGWEAHVDVGPRRDFDRLKLVHLLTVLIPARPEPVRVTAWRKRRGYELPHPVRTAGWRAVKPNLCARRYGHRYMGAGIDTWVEAGISRIRAIVSGVGVRVRAVVRKVAVIWIVAVVGIIGVGVVAEIVPVRTVVIPGRVIGRGVRSVPTVISRIVG